MKHEHMKACKQIIVGFRHGHTQMVKSNCSSLTFSADWLLLTSCSNCFLYDLLLYDCLYDDPLLKESPDFLPKGSICTSFNACRVQQN